MSTANSPAPVACCYEDCDRVANEIDSDGDPCCERCYWQHDMGAKFVELHNLVDGAALDADTARRYEALMGERGWDVTVREPRRGEAEGNTYTERGDGTLQVQRPRPDTYDSDSRACYEAVLSGADTKECEEQAREDIAAALNEWDRSRPLAWTSDEMVSFWTDERDHDKRAATIRDRSEYAAAVERLLPKQIETDRRGFEQRAGAFWIARFDYPGARDFSFVVCESEGEARGLVVEAAEEAETVQERERAARSAAVCADKVLWETYLDGKLVYADLLRAL